MLQKIRLYGIRRSLYYGVLEGRYFLRRRLSRSFSQNREDLVIDKLLDYREKGFYVDVGAFDPTRFSNTKRFYLRGWNGINIEPNPLRYKKFIKERSRDINLNIGITKKPGMMSFYMMFPETLSTFSFKEMKFRLSEGYKLIKKISVETDTLVNVLNKFAKKRSLDFLSVDTEGFDLEVLESSNWSKFRFRLVCAETGQSDGKGKVFSFLKRNKYKIVYRNSINSIFINFEGDEK